MAYDKYCFICEHPISTVEEPHTDDETGEDCHAECCSICNGKGV